MPSYGVLVSKVNGGTRSPDYKVTDAWLEARSKNASWSEAQLSRGDLSEAEWRLLKETALRGSSS
jgi:hypothetical protein